MATSATVRRKQTMTLSQIDKNIIFQGRTIIPGSVMEHELHDSEGFPCYNRGATRACCGPGWWRPTMPLRRLSSLFFSSLEYPHDVTTLTTRDLFLRRIALRYRSIIFHQRSIDQDQRENDFLLNGTWRSFFCTRQRNRLITFPFLVVTSALFWRRSNREYRRNFLSRATTQQDRRSVNDAYNERRIEGEYHTSRHNRPLVTTLLN